LLVLALVLMLVLVLVLMLVLVLVLVAGGHRPCGPRTTGHHGRQVGAGVQTRALAQAHFGGFFGFCGPAGFALLYFETLNPPWIRP
jgi:hypothetical protein